MEIPAEMQEILKAVIAEKFPADMIENISVRSVELDQDAGEVRIELLVSMDVEPEEFARGYFGLTGLLRRTIKDKTPNLNGLFPIITPIYGAEAHARPHAC